MPKSREKAMEKQPEPDDHHHEDEEEEEEEEENWCFECKEGGQLVFCDHKNCGKVYHPDCVQKDDSYFDTVKSWICDRHSCFICKKRYTFRCLGCPYAVCKKCVSAEFTVVKDVQGLCIDCVEIVKIIELNLDHDSEGKKIDLDDRETYECLFKEYWEIVKRKEGLTEEDISAALRKNRKRSNDFVPHTSCSEGEEEKQNDSNTNEDYTSMHKPNKQKRFSSMEFVGWASRPLTNFLASIGRYETEPMMQWGVKSLINEYIKEKNLYHPKDKRKFLPDDKLFPIFKKKVVPTSQIYPLLESHIAKKSDDSAGNEKPLLEKGDLSIKSGCFAPINAKNVTLIYLKRSLVLDLSKQPESFVSKVVGTFVRARVDSDDHKLRNSYHLVRVIDVEHDEMSNGIRMRVSFMPKAIPISELSDEDFTEEECEDLRQKVSIGLLPKLTVGGLQEKATSLHEDITKHWISKNLVYLQIQIERANLREQNKEKIALLDESEEPEQKQEQLLRCLPLVFPELVEVKHDDSDEDCVETDSHGVSVKVREGLTEDNVTAALPNKRKGKDFELHTSRSEDKEEQNDTNSHGGYISMPKPKKRKQYSSMEFDGWASRPLSSFLASIGRYKTEPMMRDDVKSLIYEYIKERNLYDPKDKKKFIPDDKLFPIFKKKVMSKYKIYDLLESHIAEKMDDSSGKENHDQNKNCSTENNHIDDETCMENKISRLLESHIVEKLDDSSGKENHDQNKNCSTENKHIDDETCMESKLSRLIEKPLLKKGDVCIKPGCFASINANNIKLIYLKQSLVFDLSKQPESFVSKVVGTFVRARVDSSDRKLRNSYHLVRVTGVDPDEMSNGILLEVSFMPKAIPISELSDEDFTQQECEDLWQKVNTGLIPKLTVGDLQEKATTLHEDITKHWIAKRIAYLQIQIERANLRGRIKEKIALLDEKEELEQPWKQEKLLRRVPSVSPEHMKVKYDDSDEDNG
ncbi:zinc finger CCCH domain-containing protein 19-like [Trifolium pratense]|uniref:zinc finger CCCH domain-containing protein 19-like n=1 Tax=Trifolium pratense TaxID=57577 RepID=UPI001E693A52|nr:zinc finger CCCH domain-containing protein 19-like [Trifolium pratense]